MTPPHNPSEAELVELVGRALAVLESGQTLDLDDLCDHQPRTIAAVREALDLDAPTQLADALRRSTNALRSAPRLPARFEIRGELGAGAMGVVFLAFDRALQRNVAIKVLAGIGQTQDIARQRFLRESEAAAKVRNRHVVAVFDRGATEDGELFLVMEQLHGASLAAVIHAAATAYEEGGVAALRSPRWLATCLGVSPEQVHDGYLRCLVRWIAEIADGLTALHAACIVHRDVKPSNVMIATEDGAPPRAVLLDFGIATLADRGQLTATHATLGTPWYMPPEVATGERPTQQTDGYSLAASLFHGLVLSPPREGSAARILSEITRGETPRLPAANSRVPIPRDLRAIVEHGMEYRPADRYPDCRAMAADLRAFLAHEPVSARVVGPSARLLRRIRRHPLTSTALLVFAVTAAIAAFGVPAIASQRSAARHAEWFELARTLPALLTLEGYPAERARIDAGERREQLDVLERMLALKPDDTATALVRCAVLYDAGRRDQAADAVASLASTANDPALDAIARAYHNAAAHEAQGLPDVALDELPGPTTPAGHLARAFCALRTRTPDGYRIAEASLSEVGSWLPARDLRLIALLALGRIDDAVEEARSLELVYGAPTARTRHVLGMGLASRRLYAQAIPVLEEAIALRPGRHGPVHNLGVCYQRIGDYDRARELLHRAHAIRPWLDNTLRHLAQLEAEVGNTETALEWAAKIPPTTADGSRWKRPFEQAGIAWWEVVRCASAWHAAGDTERPGARAALDAAVDVADRAFLEVLDSEPPERIAYDADVSRACIACLRDPDNEELVTWFFEAALAAPDDPAVLSNLAMVTPSGPLPGERTEHLRALLLELAARTAPESAGYRDAADRYRARSR